jgi:hypothetical protein
MADSTNAQDIPQGQFQLVAGYIDGAYRWSDHDWAIHKDSIQVRICAVTVDVTAHVADIEAGALKPIDGAQFIKDKTARGEHPSLYFSESRLTEVENQLRASGLDPYHGWSWWRANWNNNPNDGGPGVAHQYANPALTGAHYDLSSVADYWEGVDPAPAPAPAPTPAPTPTPQPAPAPGPPLDQVRAAWSQIGDLLDVAAPGFRGRLAAAVAKLKTLP